MGKIVWTINSILPKPLSVKHVEKVTNKWWPDLESEIQNIEQQLSLDVTEEPIRSERELLEEILNTVRSFARIRDDIYASVSQLGAGGGITL
jgi:hypothetical protein